MFIFVSMRNFFFAFIFLLSISTVAQDDTHLDSLASAIRSQKVDSLRLQLLDQIAKEHYNVDSVRLFATDELSLSRSLHNSLYEARALLVLNWVAYMDSDYPLAIDFAFKAIAVADSIKNVPLLANGYMSLANGFSMTMNATKADQYYHAALDNFMAVGDTAYAIVALTNLGYSHVDNDMFDEADASFRHALDMSVAINDLSSMAESHFGLGTSALTKFKRDKPLKPDYDLLATARSHFALSLQDARSAAADYFEMRAACYLADALLAQVKPDATSTDSCRALLRRAYSIADRTNDATSRIDIDFVFINYLIATGAQPRARALADSLRSVFESDPDTYDGRLGDLHAAFVDIYEAGGMLRQAINSARLSAYWQQRKHSKSYAITATQSIAQANFDEQMRKREIEVKQNEVRLEAEKRQQMIISVAAIVVLVLVSILTVYVVRSNIRSRKVNRQLDAQNAELQSQKSEIESQKVSLEHQNNIISHAHSEIKDSINYASLIQSAALPTEEFISDLFGEHFVIFRPKDVVSGDYYWASRVGPWSLFVAADCTGHGVPGAFVSMLGISILNDIAARTSPDGISAGRILDDLRSTLKTALHQKGDEDENHDGMDLALVILDPVSRILHYAGAFRPMILFHDGVMSKVEADRMPIGAHILDSNNFTDHQMQMSPGDVFYLFSDGIVDQFGYDDVKKKQVKFSAKRLCARLEQINHLPCPQQKPLVEAMMDEWRRVGTDGEFEQTDDNIIVAFRVS